MQHADYCRHMLAEVSRTFAIPISMLRPSLRDAVTTGYLLCRIVDTVEDEAALDLESRERLYASFLAVLERGAAVDAFEAAFRALPGASADLELARHLGRVAEATDSLPARLRPVVVRWVAEMARGMGIYSHRAPGSDGLVALSTLSDLERYCYFVAGTVGHMLTELFRVEVAELDPTRALALESRAEEFGLGLQLVNILKDITDDSARGWSFIPRTICWREGLEPVDLLSEGHRRAAHAAVLPVFERADRALDTALEYCLALPPTATDVRLFCLLPLWMAVRTLELARGNDAQFTPSRPVKVSREEVAHLVAECHARAADDDALRQGYAALRGTGVRACA
ncbi:MAG: squalene/phytoene synthase family protein [Deltaproteobacteria bacterium]|nr:squalene/phytoene synthase family protein [Deltaproteobacteria bacterium]